jgi:hypothetical protein
MQNLKQLSKQELLTQTQSLLTEEKKIGLQLLDYLREIERRFLFARKSKDREARFPLFLEQLQPIKTSLFFISSLRPVHNTYKEKC